jgi:outer membrane receptor for ferrienterochelin and colicins
MFRIIVFILICNVSLVAQVHQDTITYSVSLDDFVVTAQYEPIHYKKAIHQISIIKKEKIAKIGAVTLEQALVLSPSIRLYKDPILGTSVRMRGVSASNVAILIDGVPVIGRNGGAIDLSQISLQNVERIEIVEGPLSNIYGSNAAGGVINIITKKSQTSQWSIQQSNQLESIGQRNHTASIGYQKGKFNLGLNARFFNYDQYASDSLRIIDKDTLDDGSTRSTTRYPFNPKVQNSLGGYFRYTINEDQYLIAKYDNNTEDVTDYGVIKRTQFKPYATDEFYQTDRKDLSINYKGKYKDHLFLNLLTSINRYDRIRDDKRYYLETMAFDSLLQSSDYIRFDQVFGRADVNYTGMKNLVIGGGYNYTLESGTGDRLINREGKDSLISVFRESAIFTDIKYTGFKDLSLSLGNRFIFHSIYDNASTTSLQAKYDITDKLTLRASYAQGYRSPALKELYLEFIDINHNIIGNINLHPERSYDYQSTISYSTSKHIDLSMNGYYTSISDRITLTEYETLKFQYDNVDQYNVYGLQPSISYSSNGFNLSSSLSIGYWSTNIERDEVPSHGQILDLNNSLSLALPKTDVNLLINHRYVGAQPTYRLQNEVIEVGSIESYHLVDVSLSRSFWKNRINLITGARNISNTTSINVVNSSGGAHSGGRRNIVSVGRSWFVSVGFNLE